MNFDVLPEKLLDPLSVLTQVSQFILADRVYRDCTISINHKSTTVDLVKLDMVDFNGILGMDWINACYASVDRKTQLVMFQLANELVFCED